MLSVSRKLVTSLRRAFNGRSADVFQHQTAPFLVSHDLSSSAWYWPVDLILVMLESVYEICVDSSQV